MPLISRIGAGYHSDKDISALIPGAIFYGHTFNGVLLLVWYCDWTDFYEINFLISYHVKAIFNFLLFGASLSCILLTFTKF